MTRARGRSRGSRKKRGKTGSGGVWRTLAAVAGVVALGALGAYLAPDVPADAAPSVTPALRTQGRVRIEVLNAGGVAGMARRATGVLRESGFDVVSYGNASTFDPSRPSSVIDRVGRMDIAQAVANTLGIDNVQSDPDPNLYIDVSVVLGHEWIGEGSPADAEVDPRPFWDPRSWFGG